MGDLVDLNASSLSLFPLKKSPIDCQGYFGSMLLFILILWLNDVCGWGMAEVQAAVLALLQLAMAGVGTELLFSSPCRGVPLGTGQSLGDVHLHSISFV